MAGGYVIWTAPFLEPTHGVPHDYFRFTVQGGTQLLTDVGLEVIATAKGGDSMLTSSYLLGYSAAEVARYNETALVSELSRPVTAKGLFNVGRSDDADALAQKLYVSSMLVARAPSLPPSCEGMIALAMGTHQKRQCRRRVVSWRLEATWMEAGQGTNATAL